MAQVPYTRLRGKEETAFRWSESALLGTHFDFEAVGVWRCMAPSIESWICSATGADFLNKHILLYRYHTSLVSWVPYVMFPPKFVKTIATQERARLQDQLKEAKLLVSLHSNWIQVKEIWWNLMNGDLTNFFGRIFCDSIRYFLGSDVFQISFVVVSCHFYQCKLNQYHQCMISFP